LGDRDGSAEEAGNALKAIGAEVTLIPTFSHRGRARVCANKNRLAQVARTGSRKLFDGRRRAVFLEWFAATCNVKLSAERAGVAYQTVFKHRMKDEAFADAWDRALQQGYAYLEARVLQEALGVEGRPSTSLGTNGLSEEEATLVEEAFDRELAIALLREHARRLPGAGDKRKNQRTTARAATNQEVQAALVKRLKAFALRVGRVAAGSEAAAPPPRSTRSPSPGNPGEES
jgi:hypothetical protein